MTGRPTPLRAGALPTRGSLRWLRGTVVAAAASTLGLLGHLAGGATSVRLADLGALAGLVLLGSVALSGRRWTYTPLLLVLLGVQAASHVVLAGTATGHHHGGADPRMLVAHVAAAVVTARLLRDGEAWCWRLVELLARPLTVPRTVGHAPAYGVRVRAVPAATGLPALRSMQVARAEPRRGPPCSASR